MKFRAFITSLLLFLFVFYISLLTISIHMFNSQMELSKKRSINEHFLITSSFNKDLAAVTDRDGVLSDYAVKSLFEFYMALYKQQDVFLELIKDNHVLYSNLPEPSIISELSHSGSRTLSTKKIGGDTYICVIGELPEREYYIQYLYNVSDTLEAWKKTQTMLLIVGGASSIALAFLLLVLLGGIFKPLYQIGAASKEIADGQYHNRLPVSGKDELTELAISFNNMADEIQNRITQLALEAERKQQFVDNFSHEIRTPLTSIYGNAEYIMKAPLNQDEMIESMECIMTECKHILSVGENLLELSSLRNSEINICEISTRDLFQSSKTSLAHKLKEKQISLTCASGIEILYGEPDLLRNLLINLTDNAIKACDTAGSIAWEVGTKDGKSFMSVTDNGKGIPSEQIERITEPFYQIDKSGKKSGVGLGLSICKQIALCHNADLVIESHDGTTAKIIFN